MKRGLTLFLAITAIVTSSCNYISNFNKPHLELTGNGPYVLNITEFDWGYGTEEINRFNGAFEKLDEKVFDLLKGKNGTCRVYLEQKDKDKYGHSTGTMNYIGDINIDELNKFQDWQYWHKAGGVGKLNYDHNIKSVRDSAKMDSAKMTYTAKKVIDNAFGNAGQPINKSISYNFSLNDLYQTSEQAFLNSYRMKLAGTIGYVDYNGGVFQVVTNKGEEIPITFYPSGVPSEVAARLMIALKRGNKIKSVCSRTDDSTLYLISAEITSDSVTMRDTTISQVTHIYLPMLQDTVNKSDINVLGTFDIKKARVDGKDISQHYINANAGIIIYNSKDNSITFMSIVIPGEQSYTDGVMSDIHNEETPQTSKSYGATKSLFVWSFENSNDGIKGTAVVTLIREYRPEGTFFHCSTMSVDLHRSDFWGVMRVQ